MSKETMQWLNNNTLIGFTDKRGTAWHYRRADQGAESNHYPGAIPTDDIERRLFHWEPVESPISYEVNGVTYTDDTRKMIARSDNGYPLGVFRDSYTPHSYYEWLVTRVQAVLDGGLSPASAGLLKSGAVAWVQAEMPDGITTKDGVELRPFLTATTSLDGSVATTYLTGSSLVVCDNTLSGALRSADRLVKLRHTKYSKGRANEIRDALSIVFDVGEDYTRELERLCATTVTKRQWEQFLDTYVPFPEMLSADKPGNAWTIANNKREALVRLYERDERAAPWCGTAFGVLQTVNTYNQHEQTVRNAHRAERNMLNLITGKDATEEAEVLKALDAILA